MHFHFSASTEVFLLLYDVHCRQRLSTVLTSCCLPSIFHCVCVFEAETDEIIKWILWKWEQRWRADNWFFFLPVVPACVCVAWYCDWMVCYHSIIPSPFSLIIFLYFYSIFFNKSQILALKICFFVVVVIFHFFMVVFASLCGRFASVVFLIDV